MLCGAPPAGWTAEQGGRALRPPTADDAIGRAVEAKVAPATAGCTGGGTPITLVATGKWPAVDPASLVVFVDDARAELRGKRMKGTRLVWDEAGAKHDDTCLEPRVDGQNEVCAFGVGKKLPASPTGLTMTWLPAGASTDETAVTFDADGRRVGRDELALKPAKVVVARLVPAAANLDVSRGTAKQPVQHAEAITSVDCAPAFCDVEDGALVVRGITQTASALRVRVRLLPRVFLTKGDALEATPLLEVPILRCPMSIESGAPLADVDDARVVVKLEGHCADEARSLRYYAGSTTAEIVQVVSAKDGAHVVLKVGRVEEELTIRAVRGEGEGTLAAIASTPTRHLPPIAATLELEDGTPVDFIPTNRPAVVRIPPSAEGLRVVILPAPGVYSVTEEKGQQRVRATGPAGGYVALRYAIRSTSIAPELVSTNLGVVRDAVERPMRQANIAASLKGVVELRCVDKKGQTHVVPPGVPTRIPFEERDGCYVAMNRERLRPEEGAQKLVLDIGVTGPDLAARPEAHVNELTTLRPGAGTRQNWVKGVVQPFDRVTVRVSHAQDEQHYVTKAEQPLTPPASQWAVINGDATWRLYLTAAIPTVLYRVSDKATSGVLSLNFGVLGRLTWVDFEGRDGILALEAGVTGVGLAPVDTSPSNQSLRQVGTVVGLGLGVPIANRALVTQTSINLHAWFEYEFARALSGDGSPYGFVFGPSITFGNVGTYL